MKNGVTLHFWEVGGAGSPAGEGGGLGFFGRRGETGNLAKLFFPRFPGGSSKRLGGPGGKVNASRAGAFRPARGCFVSEKPDLSFGGGRGGGTLGSWAGRG